MALVVPSDGGVVLVRWAGADNEHELLAFALRGEGVARTEPDLVFDNPMARWRLFNAASDLLAHGNPSRRVVLPVGTVRVRTAYLVSDRNCAIVRWFSKQTEPSASADGPGTSL
jgi:hypothetical protein